MLLIIQNHSMKCESNPQLNIVPSSSHDSLYVLFLLGLLETNWTASCATRAKCYRLTYAKPLKMCMIAKC